MTLTINRLKRHLSKDEHLLSRSQRDIKRIKGSSVFNKISHTPREILVFAYDPFIDEPYLNHNLSFLIYSNKSSGLLLSSYDAIADDYIQGKYHYWLTRNEINKVLNKKYNSILGRDKDTSFSMYTSSQFIHKYHFLVSE